MAERGIIFGAESVRAIFDSRKTQTRRVLSPGVADFGSAPRRFWQHCDFSRAFVDGHPDSGEYLHVPAHEDACPDCAQMGWAGTMHRLYPRVLPSDWLWVREAWLPRAQERATIYRADFEDVEAAGVAGMYSDRGWRSPVFMPRSRSRITLEVLRVRIERLQKISEEDAIAEGCDPTVREFAGPARSEYAAAWDSLNSARAPWSDNPWVLVYEFRRVE